MANILTVNDNKSSFKIKNFRKLISFNSYFNLKLKEFGKNEIIKVKG